MINEYAVDPSLLTSWETVRFYLDKFGIDQGRLLAQYPSSRVWAEAVLKAFPCPPPAELVMARKRVEVRLQEAVMLFAARRLKVHWNQMLPWVANAEQEHLNNAFHAIVTRENPGNRPHVIVGDDINEDTPPGRWRVERSREVLRRGADMADALAPLFGLARTVLFIDPNFSPLDAGFRRALEAFVGRLWACCRDREKLRVEYHTGDSGPNPRQSLTAADFARCCQANLAAHIPKGLRVRFVRWRHKELHDRYVIAERGIDRNRVICAGVVFGQGLDEAGEKEDIQHVRLTLLDTAAALAVRNDFIGEKPRYSPDPGSTVEVLGARPG